MEPGRLVETEAEGARAFLLALQDEICAALEGTAPGQRYHEDRIERPGGGLSRTRILEGGAVIERSGVNFTHTVGQDLPPAATERRPELAGCRYEAVSVSLIVHPRNPYAATSHANFRTFQATRPDGGTVRWFGGGFDMTPYYGFEEDAVHWHRTARAACEPFGAEVYPRFKAWCDDYFFLRHRQEPRGIGGLFFDDLDEESCADPAGLWRSVARHYLPAYLPLLERRKDTPWGEREREFQLYRRGRYVEFNLIQDRGTLFGLQAGGRAESILASMPPVCTWRYGWRPEPGTPEARLYEVFLRPRDWAEGAERPA